MSEINRKDVTALAATLGWDITGLTVTARVIADESASPDDADCYSFVDKNAWISNKWQFVGVLVEVTDAAGRIWGSDSLWGVEHGTFPITDEQGEVTGTRELDPLGVGGEQETYPLRDVMFEALHDAGTNLTTFLSTLPSIVVRAQATS